MTIRDLQIDMNKLSVKHYKELQAVFRRHSKVLDDRKATLTLFAYMSDFIGMGWSGQDKLKIIANFLEVQKDIDARNK